MEEFKPGMQEGSFNQDKNPLTDKELAAQSSHAPHPETHFLKAPWHIAGIGAGVIGIGIAIGGYITARYILFGFFPFSPEGRVGIDILLALSSVLIAFIIETIIPLSVAKNKQIFSMLLSWLIFFGVLTIGAIIIAANLSPKV